MLDSTSCEYALAQCQRVLSRLSLSYLRHGISLCYGFVSFTIQPYLWLVDIYHHSQHSTVYHSNKYPIIVLYIILHLYY